MKRSTKEQKEAEIQHIIFAWAKHHRICRHYLFAIPNGGSRNLVEAYHLKQQGVKKGVSDMMLAYPANGAHGLWIELKRNRKAKLTPEQERWLEEMNKLGYVAKVAYGFDDCCLIIEDYLRK